MASPHRHRTFSPSFPSLVFLLFVFLYFYIINKNNHKSKLNANNFPPFKLFSHRTRSPPPVKAGAVDHDWAAWSTMLQKGGRRIEKKTTNLKYHKLFRETPFFLFPWVQEGIMTPYFNKVEHSDLPQGVGVNTKM